MDSSQANSHLLVKHAITISTSKSFVRHFVSAIDPASFWDFLILLNLIGLYPNVILNDSKAI
ncbi:hypothetical protein [Lysinibacillus xylanilyticus]|uniref:hypothetical protein n=1 Tax=Lysinibacillus xylanilyticus TaxID=582475 RepID=UPI00380952DE